MNLPQHRDLIKWMQGNFIAQQSELGILKRIKKSLTSFRKAYFTKKWGGGDHAPPVVGGPDIFSRMMHFT